MSHLRWMPLFGLTAALALALSAGTAEARLLGGPAPVAYDAGCGCEAACGPVCDYNPCIEYRHRHRLKKVCCGCCTSNVEMVLTVADPNKCGCAVAVPVCIPDCCVGEPCVTSRCGLLGRGVVTYEWCCGFKATVTFKRCGDLVVTYYGR